MLDCDNTLVQSERFAFEACADLTNQVMEKHNIDTRYTADLLLEDFVGFNFRGMLKGLQKKHNFEMPEGELDDFVEQELGAVTRKLSEKAVECPGVTTELNKLKEQGYPMSVVSTSAKSRVVASIEKAGIAHFFPPEHVYSAATSLNPPSSKPDPKVSEAILAYHYQMSITDIISRSTSMPLSSSASSPPRPSLSRTARAAPLLPCALAFPASVTVRQFGWHFCRDGTFPFEHS
jgi:beta-phosphoglucomutase-like phosphatase (HAD superfamily)